MTKADKEGQRKAPILRFKGFTDDWEQRKIKDYVNYRRGSFPQPYGKKEWYGGNNSMPFVQVVDVKENLHLADHTKQRISKLAQPKSVFVPAGEVLVTVQGSIGKVAITQYPSYIDRTLIVFEKYNTRTDKYFWAYTLQRKFEIEKRKAPGGTIKTITKKALSDFSIPITNYEEQGYLGTFFLKVDKLLTLYEKKKQLLTQLKQGIVNFLITKNGQKPQLRFSGFNNNWESKSFEKLLNYEQPTKYIVKKADYISQGTPVLTANKSFVLGYTNETNVYQNIPAIIFDDFTLESKYVDFPFMVKSSAIKILTSENSNLFFIYQLLNNQRFVQEGHSRHYISVVQKKKVLVPSIQEQNKISDLIKQLEDNIELNSNTIVLLKKLKEFLLQSMFL